MDTQPRQLLSGNEAIALAARQAGVALGAGYPGTPSTEILQEFSARGGRAEWAPNEKVALEVAIGAAFASTRALATMKHVGLNVAADPLFTAAYTGAPGGLVVVVADDPGLASSQNEQDSRHYARAAGLPMLEPTDSQEAYDLTLSAFELAERWQIPVLLRVTTRVCHSQTVVQPRAVAAASPVGNYIRNVPLRVMIPAYARVAHRELRRKLAEIAAWNETATLNQVITGGRQLGIVASGIAYAHAREAAPDASFFKLGLTYPLPLDALRRFAAGVDRCLVLEEGEPILVRDLRAAGLAVADKPAMYRFGELNVERVRRILAGDETPEPVPPRGKPPQLCLGCPHRLTFEVLRDLGCIVSGDIGCYTLGVLPPFEALDTCVCMGASLGVGLGLRHVLPPEQARKVVSVIGDSTFMHSGLTGLAEMIYNRPRTGHVLIILDNRTTAMTGLQEHPGTGRALDHSPAPQIIYEDVIRAMGVRQVYVVDPVAEKCRLGELLPRLLGADELAVVIVRRPCLLAAKRLAKQG